MLKVTLKLNKKMQEHAVHKCDISESNYLIY